ncbi:putative ribonuclease H-like domain-containing protein [Tanacetum coccineum]
MRLIISHLFERFSPFKNAFTLPPVLNVTPMDDTGIFGNDYDDEDVGAEANLKNLETILNVSPIPITRIDKDHPKDQIIRDFNSAIQTRRMTKISDEHAMTLVNLPNGKRAIGTKWVFRNKKDGRGIIVRNKARLVAQVYTQEEGIDYDKVFAPVARIEVIGLFLAYASFMGFIVYQIDVKSAFLYGTIKEEVYVCQPPGFKDPQFPDKVYKVEKALYGLHQAPRAWYKTLSTYLLENGFRRGIINKTLFIKKDKGDILLVQLYVDDIIFGSTKKSLCVMQRDYGIFISQDKYVADILKKFDFVTIKTASTLIETRKALLKDEEAKAVDVHLYISMIGSLMYLTASRPGIMFDVCAYARFQVTPKVSHLYVVKRIFRYLKGEANYVNMQSKMDGRTCNIKQKCVKSQIPKRGWDTKIPQYGGPPEKVGDEVVHKELGDRMERATTIASSLEAEQNSGNINRTKSMATLNEPSP